MESERNHNWQNGEPWEATSEAGISVSMIAEDVPTLTVATIVGVTLVVLIAIVAVFLLGVLIDCRQQRILAKKMGESRRTRNQRRVSAHPEGDSSIIVNNMEEPEQSAPPADVLRHIP